MKGFTLIETIITVALLALIMTAITTLYVSYTRAFSTEKAAIDVQLGGSTIIDAVRDAALQADAVVASHSFAGTTYYSNATTALFELPSIQSTGSVIANTYDYIGIYASGTAAYRITDIGAGSARTSGTKLLTNSLSALTFTYNNASFPSVTAVTVAATTSEAARNSTPTLPLTETIYLRNL